MVKRELKVNDKPDITTDERWELTDRLLKEDRASWRKLFLVELCEMVFEYSMFIIFIAGMTTGLEAAT